MIRHAKQELPFARRNGLESWFRHVALGAGHALSLDTSSLPPLRPRVDWGRWLVDCPGCGGAELVDVTEPVFLCLSCGNEFSGGQVVRVAFPAKWSDIEASIENLPEARQNWKE